MNVAAASVSSGTSGNGRDAGRTVTVRLYCARVHAVPYPGAVTDTPTTPAAPISDTALAGRGTQHWVLTLVCDDRPGIVHAITAAIVAAAGNIAELQQFSSLDTGRFFLRLEVDTPVTRGALLAELDPVAERFGADIRLDIAGRPMRTLVLASKAEHAVNDLLFRQRAGHLPISVPLIMANHPVLAPLAEFYGVPFEHLPVAGPDDKAAFERRVLEVVEAERIELVVLARYMQILSPELCEALEGRAINIHHSFLPGFKGANPYRQAHARGVKLVGATAHFVTTDLDEGPIIEQNVRRVDHADSVAELQSMGQDEESRTLTQAVRWFAEHRILLDGQRTIVFR
ncbi:MAG: formyltetrahydrofolate deformylase [Microbacteriaceae bacterium]|nr:formyltetrahydrofolate deformylase [Microbacteriaceae bacterium]